MPSLQVHCPLSESHKSFIAPILSQLHFWHPVSEIFQKPSCHKNHNQIQPNLIIKFFIKYSVLTLQTSH